MADRSIDEMQNNYKMSEKKSFSLDDIIREVKGVDANTSVKERASYEKKHSEASDHMTVSDLGQKKEDSVKVQKEPIATQQKKPMEAEKKKPQQKVAAPVEIPADDFVPLIIDRKDGKGKKGYEYAEATVLISPDVKPTKKTQKIDTATPIIAIADNRKQKKNTSYAVVNGEQPLLIDPIEPADARKTDDVQEDIFAKIQRERSAIYGKEISDTPAEIVLEEETSEETPKEVLPSVENDEVVSSSSVSRFVEEMERQREHTPIQKPIVMQEQPEEQQEQEQLQPAEWLARLKHLRRGLTVRASLTFVLLCVSAFLLAGRYVDGLLPQVIVPMMHSTRYLMTSGIVLALTLLLNIDVCWRGVRKLVRLRISTEGFAFLTAACCLAYDIVFINRWDLFVHTKYTCFDLLAILAIFGCTIGRRSNIACLYKNHKLAFEFEGADVICQPVADSSDNDVMVEVGRGGEIMYAAPATQISAFATAELSHYDENPKRERLNLAIVLVLAALSVGLFFLRHSVGDALLMFTAGLSASAPMFVTYTYATATAAICRNLRAIDTVLAGLDGAQKLCEAGTLITRDTDVFTAQDVALHGIRVYNNGKIDDIILELAALYHEVGGVMKDVFMGMIENKEQLLPEVSGVQLHELSGYTALIEDQTLAVGTAEFMEQMGVSLEICADEYQHIGGGKYVMYVASQNQLVAVFVLSYNVSERAQDALDMLEAEGVSLGLLTNDFYLNTELVQHQFELQDPETITVLSFDTAKACKKRCGLMEEATACLATKDGIRGLAAGLIGCSKLIFCQKLVATIKVVSAILAVPMITVLLLLREVDVMLPLQIFLYQALWSLPAYLISRTNRI